MAVRSQSLYMKWRRKADECALACSRKHITARTVHVSHAYRKCVMKCARSASQKHGQLPSYKRRKGKR